MSETSVVHKLSFKGYTSRTPFKLIYLANLEGLADLSECYSYLLYTPLNTSPKSKEQVITWGAELDKKNIENLEQEIKDNQRTQDFYNNYPHHATNDTSETLAYLKEIREKLKISLELAKEALANIEKTLQLLIEECQYMIIPIAVTKGKIKYLTNSRSSELLKISNAEGGLQKHANIFPHHASMYKSTILNASGWADSYKLVINGKPGRHPCSICPRVLHSLEGNCGFGGSYCKEHLGKVLVNATRN